MSVHIICDIRAAKSAESWRFWTKNTYLRPVIRRLLYSIVTLFVLSTLCFSQSACPGNLGENIFIQGDFGSGSTNIIPQDPGIAPGYLYSVNPPPQDGFYTITNHTGAWPNLFPTWLNIRDNSSDPNGYMMVVNASFDPGIFFEQQIENLCDDTRYEFSADIINMVGPGVGGHILPEVEFLLDGVVIFNTGSIPQNAAWNTYAFTFRTDPGVTTMTLSLRNNAPGGTGNDLALDNISFRACGPRAFVASTSTLQRCVEDATIVLDAILEGDVPTSPLIQWQFSEDGMAWTDLPNGDMTTYTHTDAVPGLYHYRFLTASSEANLANAKCRIVSDVSEVVVVESDFSHVDTLCAGNAFTFGDQTLHDPGDYTHTFTSSLGCDSIVHLRLDTVHTVSMQAMIESSGPSCNMTEDGRIEVAIPNLGRGPYSWFLNGDLQQDQRVENLSAGTYVVEIEDRFGCSEERSITFEDPHAFILQTTDRVSVRLGESARLFVGANQDIAGISWSPEEGLSCSDCAEPTLLPTRDQVYTVTVESAAGCVVTESVEVFVSLDRHVFIPNAFSPNGDGINDYFYVQNFAASVAAVERMHIFDRWGNQLFEATAQPSNDEDAGWNGRADGEIVATGVYMYVIELRFLDGSQQTFSGSLSVFR